MNRILNWLMLKLSFATCVSCDDDSPHSSHFTAFGRWYFIGRFKDAL